MPEPWGPVVVKPQPPPAVQQPAAARLGAAAVRLHGLLRGGEHVGPVEVGPALQRQEGRPHVHLEAHHGRHGVAGHAEHQGVAARAEGQRLARLRGDAPEAALHAELVLHLLDEVVLADRDAAGGDDHVVLERRGEQPPRLVEVVAGDARAGRARRRRPAPGRRR